MADRTLGSVSTSNYMWILFLDNNLVYVGTWIASCFTVCNYLTTHQSHVKVKVKLSRQITSSHYTIS